MEKLSKLLLGKYPNIDFNKEKKLIDDKILDSFSLVSLIADIEDEFNIEIPMEYISPQYFNSIEGIWNMIEELQ